jgi:hypothetical protein
LSFAEIGIAQIADSGDGSQLPLPESAELAAYRTKNALFWSPLRP